MRTIVMTAVGGPEVLELLDLPEPVPGPGEVLVEIAASGVNFMDVGVRQGMAWHEMPLPRALGVEGAGRVTGWARGWPISRWGSASPGSMPQAAMLSG